MIYRRLSPMAGVLSALIGCLVLSGWALGIDRLKSIAPGFDTMKPDAALAFVLAGMALSRCEEGK